MCIFHYYVEKLNSHSTMNLNGNIPNKIIIIKKNLTLYVEGDINHHHLKVYKSV